MFSRVGVRSLRAPQVVTKRLNHHDAAHHTSSTTEVNVPKAIGGFVLAGIALYFYRSTKDEAIIKTPLYNQQDDRQILRNENYLTRYKTSFIKGYIKDKGGIGQKQVRRPLIGATPVNLIPTHSPTGDQFGAGIKLSNLGPRKERPRYFAPLSEN